MAGCQIEHALLGNRSLLPRRFYPRMECNKCVALFLGWHLGGFIWGFAADPATRWFGDDLQMTRSCAGFLKRQLCITGEAFLGWSLGVLNCPNVAVTSQPPNSTPLPVHQPQPRPENGGGDGGIFIPHRSALRQGPAPLGLPPAPRPGGRPRAGAGGDGGCGGGPGRGGRGRLGRGPRRPRWPGVSKPLASSIKFFQLCVRVCM